MKLLYTVFLIAICISNSFAQKQSYNWYFGQQCALNFSSGSPIFVTGGQTGTDGSWAQEGSSSISDSAGNLLFYSGGQTVWNRNNQVMPHGDSILGGVSTTQSCLIVPLPGSNNLFYLFTLDEFQSLKYGFRYSIIDMCLDNGLGDVIPCKKNILLLDTMTEKLCAQRDSLGNYWILVHKLFSDAFYAYYLSPGGITKTVVTHIGTFHGGTTYNSQTVGTAIGQMKFSPNGKKVALAIGNQVPNLCDLFDFDVKTGIVSNWIRINYIPDNTGTGYGVEFSPDNSKLYLTDFGALALFQYNLLAGDSNAIIASRIGIDTLTTSKCGLQLGPDGKIYMSQGYDYLGVINKPNLSGTACNFVDNLISLQGYNCYFSLPGFVASFNYSNTVQVCPLPAITNEIAKAKCSDTTGNVTVSVRGGKPPYSFLWNTTPPQTDSTGTGLKPGTYVVTITNILDSCVLNTTYDTVQLSDSTGTTVTVNSPTICNGNNIALIASGASTYTWLPSAGLNTTTGFSVVANPSVTTTYTLIGVGGGCTDTTHAIVTVKPSPIVQIVPQTPFICSGAVITLFVPDSTLSFAWSPAASLNTTSGASVIASPTVNTTYTVVGTDSLGCSAIDTDAVLIAPHPNKPHITVSVTGDTLFSSATQDNQWYRNDTIIPGATDTILIITGHPSGNYFVLVINPAFGCSASSDTLHLTGINELSAINNQLSIYPNPFNNTIFVTISSSAKDIKDWNLEVNDVLGRRLFNLPSLGYSNEIDLSDLPNGMYFISITNGKDRAVFKVVKQN